MANVAIVFHSGYGHTEKLAAAVGKGAQTVADITLHSIQIDEQGEVPADTWATLEQADAIVFGSPTYMGAASWQFKKFADASSKPWFTENWKDKLAAGFTNSASMNGDKLRTLDQFFTLAMQHGMLWIGLGMHSSNAKTADRNDLNYVGAYSGLMATSPSDASPAEAPLPGDLQTAEAFGKRVAEATKRLGS